jgi:hypothetical protein
MLGMFMYTMLLLSCSAEQQPQYPVTETRAPAPATVTEEEPEVVYESIDEQEAIDFVTIWSKIYSTNTFSSYVDLYNKSGFKGIKRTFTGETNSYNYSGWIKNKRNEFAKYRPTVEVEDIRVTSSNRNGKTIVHFTQYWYSNAENSSYSDKGTKTMTLIKVNGKIRITHEELLYSEPLEGGC